MNAVFRKVIGRDSEAKKVVLGIPDLRKEIMHYAEPKTLFEGAQWMFVSKHYYDLFTRSVHRSGFNSFVTDYCLKKIKTNPCWSYHACEKVKEYIQFKESHEGKHASIGVRELRVRCKNAAGHVIMKKQIFRALILSMSVFAVNIALNGLPDISHLFHLSIASIMLGVVYGYGGTVISLWALKHGSRSMMKTLLMIILLALMGLGIYCLFYPHWRYSLHMSNSNR